MSNEREAAKEWYAQAHWGNEDFKTAVLRGYEAGAEWQRSLAQAELAALNITSQQLRERVAELETDLKLTSEMLVGVSRKGMTLQEELATLKSAPVVMPERKKLPELMMATYHEYRGWNACLDEFERLNRSKTNEQ